MEYKLWKINSLSSKPTLKSPLTTHLAREQLSWLLVYLQLEPVLVSHSTALSRLDSNMIQTFKGGVEASLRNKLSSRLYRTPVQIGETRHSVAATGGAGGGERGAGRSGAAAAGVPRTGPGAVSSHQAVVTVERRALDTATHLDITRHLDMSAHVTWGAW